jgi:hypothetical protein
MDSGLPFFSKYEIDPHRWRPKIALLIRDVVEWVSQSGQRIIPTVSVEKKRAYSS